MDGSFVHNYVLGLGDVQCIRRHTQKPLDVHLMVEDPGQVVDIFVNAGVGISIAANKVKGIRCVCCSEPYSALLSRQHNDTNMLAMGSRVVGRDLALMIVDQWLSGTYEGGHYQIRLDEIHAIEESGTLPNREK